MTDERITLQAASYKLVCPSCGGSHFLSEDTRFVQCECGKTIATEEPRHCFDGASTPVGVPVVASYRWSCPDCTKMHFEPSAVLRVRCGGCGATFEVAAAEHGPQMRQIRLF